MQGDGIPYVPRPALSWLLSKSQMADLLANAQETRHHEIWQAENNERRPRQSIHQSNLYRLAHNAPRQMPDQPFPS